LSALSQDFVQSKICQEEYLENSNASFGLSGQDAEPTRRGGAAEPWMAAERSVGIF